MILFQKNKWIYYSSMKNAVLSTSVDFLVCFKFLTRMLTLTESAASQIKRLQEEQADAEHRLRIFVDAGGCSGFEYGMSFSCKQEGDHEFEDRGVSFYMDAASLEYMKGSVVEFDDSLHGKGFQIQNPNATNTCGCGRSFN